MITTTYTLKYPRCWKRVSRLIRKLANGHCEWCGQLCDTLSVHHIGTRRPTGNGWKNGNPCDKHDIRRENLAALCERCHDQADAHIRRKCGKARAKRAAKREAHQALGIGTGLLVCNAPARPRRPIPYAIILYAIHFHMTAQREQTCPQCIVDSTLTYIPCQSSASS